MHAKHSVAEKAPAGEQGSATSAQHDIEGKKTTAPAVK